MADDTQPSTSDTAVQRADALLDQAGQRLGSLAARARMRVQEIAAQGAQAAQNAANRAASPGQNGALQDEQPHATADGAPPAMDRAEELVDIAGQRLSAFGQATNQRMQVLFARLREEGEDIWAEAQSLRRPESHDSQRDARDAATPQ